MTRIGVTWQQHSEGRAAREDQAHKTKGKKKCILTFHQCNFEPPLQPLRCMPSREHQQLRQRGGGREGDALMAKAIGWSLCPMSVFMDTLDRRLWERGLRRKGTDRKKIYSAVDSGWPNKSCQGCINTFMSP